jgi:hypothetical protein
MKSLSQNSRTVVEKYGSPARHALHANSPEFISRQIAPAAADPGIEKENIEYRMMNIEGDLNARNEEKVLRYPIFSVRYSIFKAVYIARKRYPSG